MVVVEEEEEEEEEELLVFQHFHVTPNLVSLQPIHHILCCIFPQEGPSPSRQGCAGFDTRPRVGRSQVTRPASISVLYVSVHYLTLAIMGGCVAR
jgi:hypothetical protein